MLLYLYKVVQMNPISVRKENIKYVACSLDDSVFMAMTLQLFKPIQRKREEWDYTVLF